MYNEKTLKTLKECEQGIGLNKCKSIDDFFKQLESDIIIKEIEENNYKIPPDKFSENEAR